MNRRPLIAFALLPFAVAACQKAKVVSYQIPKEAAPSAASAADSSAPSVSAPFAAAAAPMPGAPMGNGAMANTPVATAIGATLSWTAPSKWKEKPAQPMRKATYTLSADGAEAELSITAFPGDVGGELANVNRWRGQVDLEPITAAELGKSIVRMEKNGLKMAIVDASAGASGKRILGAMIPFGGSTWFFKVGPASDAAIGKVKSDFLAFLETVKPGA